MTCPQAITSRRVDGYRYVRSYRLRNGRESYALWERIDGKARRVGTARTETGYRQFLGMGGPR